MRGSLRFVYLLVSLGVLLHVGCGSDTKPSVVHAEPASHSSGTASQESRRGSARDYLAAVFARYRNASAYSDRGVVRMAFKQEGRSVTREAPAQVWLDHDRLYLEAYDARLWCDSNRLNAWIVDPTSDHFDSQVLAQPPLAGRPTLDDLFKDPVLLNRVAAGLAGPPPQLEWLLAAEPMKQLFDAQHQFAFGPDGTIHGFRCQSVRVTVDNDAYVFWVDAKQSLVRRVEFPTLSMPTAGGEPAQAISLWLDLAGADFRAASDLDPDPFPPDPKRVRNFVPLPPPAPDQRLGQPVPELAFTGANPSASQATALFSTTEFSRPLCLVMRVAADPLSYASAEILDQWYQRVPDSMRSRMMVRLLVEPAALPQLSSELEVPVYLDRERSAEGSLQLGAGESLLLSQDGLLQWHHPALAAGDETTLAQLGAVSQDILQGIDVPARLQQQWKAQVDAYRQALREQQIQ